ncbi:calpastatin [Sphingomonas sp. Leaf407]|uniref:DUF1810 domain-containing protein n=1 Tax=unclassified Sphingomonas TaxID=196159 RepID=UPI0006FC21DD|nr:MULTISPECIES: DUF1810 domain-containing protein [unclassified Sphingomonas]KQN35578.1 calpastatin [Sphingomonas sp. Leaf42]KQT26445.1 calpastatin [Sphingomonas sp. Leaf407]
MTDPLDRFVEAQRATWDQALAELVEGEKRGHWMWFVLPQLRGLGFSTMAQRYGIADVEEAKAYLAHPVLGPRLRQAAQALLAHDGRDIDRILGEVDAMKLRSSMTLFEAVAGDDTPFGDVLDTFYDGERDEQTLEMLR